MLALAKFTWALYSQWKNSTPTSKSDSAEKEQSGGDTPAKTSEKTSEGVNGGIDEHKDGSKSDTVSSKERTASTGSDDGTKVKRRRGKWVPQELRTFAKQEDEKPYVPPAYYCEDEEEDLNSEEDGRTSSSDLDEPLELQDDSDTMALSHETGSNDEGADGDRSVQEGEEKVSQEMSSRNAKNTDTSQEASSRNANNVDESPEMSSRNVKKDSRICGKDEDEIVTVSSGEGASSSTTIMVSNVKDGACRPLPWSRYQQKQLEWALVQYPKFAKDRWDNIAKAVPGKNKVLIFYVVW